MAGDDESTSDYDFVVFGRVTILVAPSRQYAVALCQPGWDEDRCPDWAEAMRFLDQYGLADAEVNHLTDWTPHPDGSDTFIIRKNR